MRQFGLDQSTVISIDELSTLSVSVAEAWYTSHGVSQIFWYKENLLAWLGSHWHEVAWRRAILVQVLRTNEFVC